MSDDFRELVEGRMTSEEYVRRLRARVDEQRRKEWAPGTPRDRRRRRRIHDWVDYLRGGDRRIT